VSAGTPLAAIVGVGARTHTGRDALAATMTWRARRSLPRETPMVDRAGEPIGMCRARALPDDLLGLDRFVALAAPALAEAARDAGLPRDAAIALHLALPAESEPRTHAIDAAALLAALGAASGIPVHARRSTAHAAGRGAGLVALAAAVERLRVGAEDLVVVGGVDSYYDPGLLESLDAAYRLHSLTAENGYLPGEGAAFLVLERSGRAAGRRARANVLSALVEREPRPFGNAEPTQGLAISLAVRRALEPARAPVRWALTDVVNERHRIDEWVYASARAHRQLAPDARHDQPLLTTGDLGAASGVVLAALAATCWSVGAAPADQALVAVHGDDDTRAAALLTAGDP
jgi:3-oxoacyl-[acyl-carrier-protein] synthase-1